VVDESNFKTGRHWRKLQLIATCPESGKVFTSAYDPNMAKRESGRLSGRMILQELTSWFTSFPQHGSSALHHQIPGHGSSTNGPLNTHNSSAVNISGAVSGRFGGTDATPNSLPASHSTSNSNNISNNNIPFNYSPSLTSESMTASVTVFSSQEVAADSKLVMPNVSSSSVPPPEPAAASSSSPHMGAETELNDQARGSGASSSDSRDGDGDVDGDALSSHRSPSFSVSVSQAATQSISLSLSQQSQCSSSFSTVRLSHAGVRDSKDGSGDGKGCEDNQGVD
jgi:hypothetical protein